MFRGNDPFNEPCPLYGAMIELGLCSDTTEVVDGAVKERLIAPNLKEFGLGRALTDAQREICRACPRRKLI